MEVVAPDGDGSRGGSERLAVDVRGLRASYGSTVVFDDLSLAVPRGAAICVVGENGVGKTTLLRCVSGTHRIDAGAVVVFGMPAGSTTEFWRMVAGTVESPSWHPGLTVREHAELVRLAHGADPHDGVIDRVFEALGIARLGDNIPMTLSSGQKQRLILSMVLLRPSRLLLLDEPEQRLDPTIKTIFAGVLRDYRENGGTVLITSHDQAFAEAAGCEIRLLDAVCGG